MLDSFIPFSMPVYPGALTSQVPWARGARDIHHLERAIR